MQKVEGSSPFSRFAKHCKCSHFELRCDGNAIPPAREDSNPTTRPVADQVTDHSLTGGCLCGGIRFELTEPATDAGYCHCTRCQRRTGTAASAQARVDSHTLRILQGEDLLKCWRHHDGGHEKCFCSECGAHLFSRSPESPAYVSVRMGAFDGDPGVRPMWRSFVDYAAPWEPIPDDGLERLPEAKPRVQAPFSE